MSSFLIKYSAILALVLLGPGAAVGQQATELFIPIGNSPGVSDSGSLRGEIRHVDYESHSIEVQGIGGARTFTVDYHARYYLDRTGQRRSNTLGSMTDCKVGSSVEVRFLADGKVDWIKIEAP